MTRLLRSIALAGSVGLASAASAAAPSFDELDTNQDGVLSMQEASAVKTLDFAKADTNRDGKLDRSEYRAATS